MKFLKPGKVVIVLNGRFAGKKAVIVRNYDDGTKDRPYGHCILAGIQRYPRDVKRHMSKKRMALRSRVKPFLKVANYQHIMPTRYGFDADLKNTITAAALSDPTRKSAALKAVKKVFQERYIAGKNKWFFTKLRF